MSIEDANRELKMRQLEALAASTVSQPDDAPSLDELGEALHRVNKEAKKSRDLQRAQESLIDWSCRYEGLPFTDREEEAYDVLMEAKWRKEGLYDLKDDALSAAISLFELEPEGYHEFPDRPRDLYRLGRFTVHRNGHDKRTINLLGTIDRDIDSTVRGDIMGLGRAKEVCHRAIAIAAAKEAARAVKSAQSGVGHRWCSPWEAACTWPDLVSVTTDRGSLSVSWGDVVLATVDAGYKSSSDWRLRRSHCDRAMDDCHETTIDVDASGLPARPLSADGGLMAPEAIRAFADVEAYDELDDCDLGDAHDVASSWRAWCSAHPSEVVVRLPEGADELEAVGDGETLTWLDLDCERPGYHWFLDDRREEGARLPDQFCSDIDVISRGDDLDEEAREAVSALGDIPLKEAVDVVREQADLSDERSFEAQKEARRLEAAAKREREAAERAELARKGLGFPDGDVSACRRAARDRCGDVPVASVVANALARPSQCTVDSRRKKGKFRLRLSAGGSTRPVSMAGESCCVDISDLPSWETALLSRGWTAESLLKSMAGAQSALSGAKVPGALLPMPLTDFVDTFGLAPEGPALTRRHAAEAMGRWKEDTEET